MEIGQSFVDFSAKEAKTLIEELEEIDNHIYKQGAEIISKALHYREIKGKRDFKFLVEYAIRFGTSHLINKTHRLHPFFLYDMDIWLLILGPLFLGFVGLLCCCRKRKSLKEKKD
mmetsp:Transcript_18048/g.17233  ORF Transcript_18048/g.17233 Transcript_18048/m.17233 type:complete len:115 (+) Transcript_18048:1199-1543(+)